jgi:hypothetical protein
VLHWNVTDAQSVFLEGVGDIQSAGSLNISPQSTTTYRIAATGKGLKEPDYLQLRSLIHRHRQYRHH